MLRRLAALVLAPLLLLGAVAATSANAADPHAASFVAKANGERQARGLPAYAVRSDLAAVAARHSARMAAQGTLHHNPNLGSEVSGWQVVGENVGTGGSVESIHRALMDSPTHRANILARDYTEIGVGTVTDDKGVIWVTQVFRRPMAAPKAIPPVTRSKARVTLRVPQRAVAPVAVAPAAPAPVAPPPPVRVAVRPDAGAFAAALVPSAVTAAGDPFARVLAYADTMAALNR